MAPEPLNPGDVAPELTPGTAEDFCPKCGGTGKVIHGIGGV